MPVLGQADQAHLGDGGAAGVFEQPLRLRTVVGQELSQLLGGGVAADQSDDAHLGPQRGQVHGHVAGPAQADVSRFGNAAPAPAHLGLSRSALPKR